MTVHDLAPIHRGLKDFQRASVEHASARLFSRDGSRRFLVADEVGLGKTHIARGVIARAIEHHVEQGTDRIDVIYVCSNGDIAQQNIRRLNILEDHDFTHASRLTLLPKHLADLRSRRLNFISFTPGTSFNMRSTEGTAEERALIHNMLWSLWGDDVRWGVTGEKVFAGWSGFERFSHLVWSEDNQQFDESLLASFDRKMQAHPGGVAELQARYDGLWDRYRHVRAKSGSGVTDELRWARASFVGTLRGLVARACIEALEPDLVILDEFQRFKQLLDPDDESGSLAQALFAQPDVAVLMLSATPYKMYTRGGEEGDDHYRDFLDTARFLLQDDEALDELRRDIVAFRRALFQLGSDGDAIDEARRHRGRIETTLRTVMSRNERLAATPSVSSLVGTGGTRTMTEHEGEKEPDQDDIHDRCEADRPH